MQNNLLDCIGNLTLLPKDVNSYLNNVKWDVRRSVYSYLAGDYFVFEEVSESLNLDKKQMKQLESIQEKIASATEIPYLDTLTAITEYKVFDYTQIEERGKKILDDVWKPLTKWLGTDAYENEQE